MKSSEPSKGRREKDGNDAKQKPRFPEATRFRHLPAPNQLWDTLACGTPSLPVSTSLSLASHRGMATKMDHRTKKKKLKTHNNQKKDPPDNIVVMWTKFSRENFFILRLSQKKTSRNSMGFLSFFFFLHLQINDKSF